MVADYLVVLNNVCKNFNSNVALQKKSLIQGAFAQLVVILSLFQRYASSCPLKINHSFVAFERNVLGDSCIMYLYFVFVVCANSAH